MFRGEVWRMSLAQKPGETANVNRLVVILSSDALGTLPLKVIVPLTPWKDDYASAPWMVRVPPVLNSGLEVAMAADALQVRSVSNARLVSRLGELPGRVLDQVAAAVAVVIEGRGAGEV
jgi:mRNA interferase MazF